MDISIHPPPARGGDVRQPHIELNPPKFQSTPPARGGDLCQPVFVYWQENFNPRPPRGGATADASTVVPAIKISIHAPREGGRLVASSSAVYCCLFQSTPPARGGDRCGKIGKNGSGEISIHAPREGGRLYLRGGAIVVSLFQSTPPARGGDSKDAQFYLRIFDKQVELLRFLGKIRGGCLRNPEKDRRFLGKSLANLPEISGHLDFAGGGKARPGYPCAVPLPRRAACVRGSGDPPADRCSSYRNAPLFSHIASLDSKSEDCPSQNP